MSAKPTAHKKETIPGNSEYIDCCYMRIALREIDSFRGNYAVVVHGPAGCSTDLTFSGCHDKIYCTNLEETDIVMGGEEKLRETVLGIGAEKSHDVIFILGTCTSEIIGDDVKGIARKCSEEMGREVIALSTSGLSGMQSKESSFIALKNILPILKNSAQKKRMSINIIENSWPLAKGIKQEIECYFNELGITVNTVPSNGLSFDEALAIPSAELNVFFDMESAMEIGREMELRFSQSYISCSPPFGVRATSRIFFDVAKFFGKSDAAKKKIALWEKSALEDVSKAGRGAKGKKAAIACRKLSVDFARAFSDLGLIVEVYTSEKSSLKDIERCKKLGISVINRKMKDSDADGFDIVYGVSESCCVPSSFAPPNFMNSPQSLLFYSGAAAFAKEISHEIRDSFNRKYGGGI